MFTVMESREILPGVWVFTSALYQTTSTIIVTSEVLLVVDPNWSPDEITRIVQMVAALREGRDLYLLFTHSDYDHILGYGAFDADHVIASLNFVNSDHKEQDIEDARNSDRINGFVRNYPLIYPEADCVIENDTQQLSLGGCMLTFYIAQGHTREGIFTVIEPFGLLLAGDYLSDVEFPLVQDIRAYQQTLGKVERILQHHRVRYLIPGHGTVADTTNAILQRRDEALQYLDHLEGVLQGASFPEEQYRLRYPTWQSLLEWHRENVERVSDAWQENTE